MDRSKARREQRWLPSIGLGTMGRMVDLLLDAKKELMAVCTSHNTKRHQRLTPESSLTSLRKRFVEVRRKAKSERKSVNAPWKSQNFRDSEVWHLSN